jgi:hypothetical protein
MEACATFAPAGSGRWAWRAKHFHVSTAGDYSDNTDDRIVYLNQYNDRSLEWMGWLLLPVVFGYITMTRSFAHLGVAPLYVGEATLGVLLLLRPEMILGTWLRAQLRPSAYANLALLTGVFVAYGFFQCLRGLSDTEYPKVAIQNFAFNYYFAFLFAGMWLGERHGNLLPRIIWWLAWANAIYGIIYLAFLGHVLTPEEHAANAVQTFGWPAGSAIAILGLLAFRQSIGHIFIPLVLNGLVLLGMQVRAEWVGLGAGIALLSLLSGRIWTLIQASIVIGALLFIAVLVDLSVPSPTKHGGVISSRDMVGRAVAAVDERAAAQLTENAEMYSGSVSWRKEWWTNLLKVTHKHTSTALFGMGYGYPIWEHNPYIDGINPTPHNIFMYILTYTGWVGVAIYYTLQFYLASLLWRAYRTSGQPFGICLWALLFVWAHLDNRLETPYGAIPFCVLVGMALTAVPAKRNSARQDFGSSSEIDRSR